LTRKLSVSFVRFRAPLMFNCVTVGLCILGLRAQTAVIPAEPTFIGSTITSVLPP
jgi:hypothetical protein